MNKYAAAVFVLLFGIYSAFTAAAALIEHPFSSVIVYDAETEIGDLPESTLESVKNVTVSGLSQLRIIPADEGLPLEVTPYIIENSESLNEITGAYEVRMRIELEIRSQDFHETRSLDLLATGPRLDLAKQEALLQYRRQIGFLFSEIIAPSSYYQIDSLYHGYITGAVGSEPEVSPGDTMVILQDGEEQIGALSVSRVFQYQEDPPSYAAAYQLEYTKVPLSVGMVLEHRETSRFDVRLDLRQSLGSTDAGIFLLYDLPPSSLQVSAGFSGGYSWAQIDRMPFIIDGSEAAWGAVSAGISIRLLPNRRYKGPLIRVVSVSLSGSGEAGLSKEGRWFVGAIAELRTGYRLYDKLELGIGLGYQVRRSLVPSGQLLRSMLYISPSVTIGL